MQIITTDNAPAAIGPYSQAVRAGDTLYISGQIALDPQSGELIGATTAEQAVQVLANINAILLAAGARRTDIVKCSIFLADLGDFTIVNEIYSDWFGQHKPARECIEAARLPRDARIEISVIAAL